MPDEPSLELPSPFRRKRRPLVEERRSPVTLPRSRRVRALPASILTGAAAGLLLAGLIWLANHGCGEVRGTSSCGAAGYGPLLVILVLVVVGAVGLLKVLGVPQAGSTAALGVALLVVLAIVSAVDLSALVGTLLVTGLGALAFGVSQWLTSSFTEPGDRPR